MADLINLQQTEYDELQTKLTATHLAIEKGEAEIRKACQELVTDGGGFFVKDISANVLALLLQMEIIINTSILNEFCNSEQEIATFIQSIIETDVTSS